MAGQFEIEHSVRASVFLEQYRAQHGDDTHHYYSGFSSELEGVLMEGRYSRRVVKSFPHGEPDVVSLKQLLAAANVTLDDTLRQSGVTVYADLAYNNARCNLSLSCAFGVVPLSYRYRVSAVPDSGVRSFIHHSADANHLRD